MPRLSSEQMAIGLVFVAIGTLGCLSPVQSDTWWLFRAGQDIWRTGSIPLVDTYSHTAVGLFWPNHEWLTEAVFFGLHTVGGLFAVVGLSAACITAAWGLSWRLTPGEFEARFLLFTLGLVSAAGGWAVRPQVFTLLLFAVFCTLLASGRKGPLPWLCIVWANLHGAVALGIVIVGAAALADLLTTRRWSWSWLVTGLACLAGTLVSPLGWRLWTFIPQSTEKSRINQLSEWTPPDLSAGFWPFWLLAAALLIVLGLRWRGLPPRSARLVAMAMAVLPLAITSQRNVAVFLLVAVPAVAALLAAGHEPRRRVVARENGRVNFGAVSVAALGAAVLVGLVWARPPDQLGWRPIAPSAVTAIEQCEDPIYNTYGGGGVLIWFVPDHPVFIDNRQDPYPMDHLVANRDAEFTGNFEGLFAQHGIRCAVVPPGSVLSDRLMQAPNWEAAFADDDWMVFTPQTAGAMAPASSAQ